MSIAQKMLDEFDAEFANARKLLTLVPDAKLGWKPHPKSMEMGRLAWHISDLLAWSRQILEKDALAMTDEDGRRAFSAWKGKSRADSLARFDSELAAARADLEKATDSGMLARWKMEWAGRTVADEPRVDVLRKFVLNHMIHHRAQLGVYLRMNDIPIPGCYGPSADEAPAWA